MGTEAYPFRQLPALLGSKKGLQILRKTMFHSLGPLSNPFIRSTDRVKTVKHQPFPRLAAKAMENHFSQAGRQVGSQLPARSL